MSSLSPECDLNSNLYLSLSRDICDATWLFTAAGESKAFPGQMGGPSGVDTPDKKSSLLYKIGHLTNISKISLQTKMASSRRGETKTNKRMQKQYQEEKKKIQNKQSPSSGDQCLLHLIFIFT